MSRKRSVALGGLVLAGLVPAFAATFSAQNSSSESGLAISDVSVQEDQRTVTLTVTRPAVNYWTSTNFDLRPGTAQEGADYVRASNHIMFNPGETTKTVSVPIVADNVAEGPETFTAVIYGTDNVPISRAEATVTITESGLAISDVSVQEDQRTVTLTVTRPAVNYWTSTNFDLRPGTAQEGADYVRASNHIMFNPGETTKTVSVPIVADNVAEGPETFTAVIYGTDNVPITRADATVTITESPSSGPIAGEASIPSNFDVASELVPSWGTGAIAESAASYDVVGAFRFICNPGQLLADDPVVYPGQPGKAHLHQFFGNTAANANSTYKSLRTTGMSTCNSPLNRSAYWIPAMMNGKGRVVRPDYIQIYYKRRPDTDPKCNADLTTDWSQQWGVQGKCVNLPRGLRFVFGHNMMNPASSTGFSWKCEGAGAVEGNFPNIVKAAKGCPVGAQLGVAVGAPDCWDGKNLDSPDHRSHMAYPGYGGWGYLRCPSTHPYVVPSFFMGVWYTTDADLDRSGTWAPGTPTWHLSSDKGHGMPDMTPGESFHADWFGAWDDSVMKMWTDHCINKLLNCSGGDLGNGKQLRMFDGFKWRAEPRVVDAPA